MSVGPGKFSRVGVAYTEKAKKAVGDLLRAKKTIRDTSRLTGIGRHAIYDWIEKGVLGDLTGVVLPVKRPPREGTLESTWDKFGGALLRDRIRTQTRHSLHSVSVAVGLREKVLLHMLLHDLPLPPHWAPILAEANLIGAEEGVELGCFEPPYLGGWLKTQRKSRKMSQQEFADHLGVMKTTVEFVENASFQIPVPRSWVRTLRAGNPDDSPATDSGGCQKSAPEVGAQVALPLAQSPAVEHPTSKPSSEPPLPEPLRFQVALDMFVGFAASSATSEPVAMVTYQSRPYAMYQRTPGGWVQVLSRPQDPRVDGYLEAGLDAALAKWRQR